MTRRGAPRPGPTFVYRVYDADDALMYIGASNDVTARIKAHRVSDRFFGVHIARVETEEFATRYDALEAEAAAIRAEDPYFNAQGRLPIAVAS